MTQTYRISDTVPVITGSPAVGGRTLRSRVSSGHVVMVVAGVLGLLLSLSVLRRAEATVPVLVVAHDVVPGTRVQANLFRTTTIHADPSALANLVTPAALVRLRGSVVLRSMHAGDLLERSAVGPASTRRAARSVSFPVDSALAVGGQVEVGDRVDVLASATEGGASGYVLVGVDVVAVQSNASGPLRVGDGQITLTVAVDAAGAQRLAAALHGADLLVVRSTGAAPVTGVRWFTGDGAGAGDG